MLKKIYICKNKDTKIHFELLLLLRFWKLAVVGTRDSISTEIDGFFVSVFLPVCGSKHTFNVT